MQAAKKEAWGLWPSLKVADTFGSRLKGLMGRKEIGMGEALFFPDCPSVHMMFMSCPLDVIAVAADGRVLGIDTVRPWEKVAYHKGASAIVESAAGSASTLGLAVGDILEFDHKRSA